jgi:hypothetical protein
MSNLILTDNVDKEKLLNTGIRYLELGLEGVISEINAVVKRLNDEDGYFGHWQAKQRDIQLFEKEIDNYRTAVKQYKEYGFALEGYSEEVANFTSNFNYVHILYHDQKE